jgi:hypothetical protein
MKYHFFLQNKHVIGYFLHFFLVFLFCGTYAWPMFKDNVTPPPKNVVQDKQFAFLYRLSKKDQTPCNLVNYKFKDISEIDYLYSFSQMFDVPSKIENCIILHQVPVLYQVYTSLILRNYIYTDQTLCGYYAFYNAYEAYSIACDYRGKGLNEKLQCRLNDRERFERALSLMVETIIMQRKNQCRRSKKKTLYSAQGNLNKYGSLRSHEMLFLIEKFIVKNYKNADSTKILVLSLEDLARKKKNKLVLTNEEKDKIILFLNNIEDTFMIFIIQEGKEQHYHWFTVMLVKNAATRESMQLEAYIFDSTATDQRSSKTVLELAAIVKQLVNNGFQETKPSKDCCLCKYLNSIKRKILSWV